jgi:replication-associated recombination protein RarA
MEQLFGYEEIETSLTRFHTKPGHIFLLGPPGSGKTTLIRNFLHSYFTHHYGDQAETMKKSDIFFMNSHQDRGIHTVRNVLLDYCRQPTCKPGTVRWIIIDHLESFPELSQQALRRPMELYSHVACFIFIGTNRNHIIAPLMSRCKIVKLPDVQLELISSHILNKFQATEAGLPHESIVWLISHSAGIIREFCQYVSLIVEYLKITNPRAKQIHGIILEICSIPSFDLYMPLITSILQSNKIDILRNLTKLWTAGESFEDIFETVKKITDMFGYTGVEEGYKIYEFLMNGWIQYSQGYTTYRSLLSTAI